MTTPPIRALLAALALALPALVRADPPAPPKSWIDPDTGHRVIRLTDTPGSNSLYFNDGNSTPDGHEMVFTTTADFSAWVVDLRTGQSRMVVKGPFRTICMGRKRPSVFYVRTE